VKALSALLVAAALCTGCFGSLLESGNEAPEVYRLAGAELANRGEPLPVALAVAPPRAASSLDSERVAVVQPDSRFEYFSGVRWAEPAPQMLQRMVVRALAADGRFTTVVAAPSRVPADLALDLELRRFEAVYSGGDRAPLVRVEMQVTLIDARNSQRLSSFVVSTESLASANRRSAMFEAFERATAEAIETTVSRLREATAGTQS
jgi:cholesterol transport system auxiliary component